jgi:hypothetical protein
MSGLSASFKMSLRNSQRAFDAGYSYGFHNQPEKVPYRFRNNAEMFRAGFKAGQFDKKVEKI